MSKKQVPENVMDILMSKKATTDPQRGGKQPTEDPRATHEEATKSPRPEAMEKHHVRFQASVWAGQTT